LSIHKLFPDLSSFLFVPLRLPRRFYGVNFVDKSFDLSSFLFVSLRLPRRFYGVNFVDKSLDLSSLRATSLLHSPRVSKKITVHALTYNIHTSLRSPSRRRRNSHR
jgi:hypothetical protein